MLAMITSSPNFAAFQMEFEGIPISFSTPRKFQERVVCNFLALFSNTDITLGFPVCQCFIKHQSPHQSHH